MRSRLRMCATGARGFTLVEMTISVGVGAILLVGLISASFAVQTSIKGTDHYLKSTNDGNRLLDYVAQDLRRAVRAGTLSTGTYTPVKNAASFAVTDTVTFAINVPDVYATNIPGDATAATYRVSRYNRAVLNTHASFNSNATGSILNGCVPFDEAIKLISSKQLLRYAPSSAGTGEMQVRYSRRARSAGDATLCFFRAEYPVGSETPFAEPQEIANQLPGDDTPINLLVSVPNVAATDSLYGRIFQLQTSFVPRYRRAMPAGTTSSQSVRVILRNPRRD